MQDHGSDLASLGARSPRSPLLDVLVVAAGAISTIGSLVGVFWIGQVDPDFQIMGWYGLFVIPVGAILVGMASGSGYGFASWWTGRKVGGGLLVAVAVLLTGAYAAAQWLEFASISAAYETGEPVGFFAYYDLATRSMEFTIGRSGSSTTGALGVWGYAFRALELLGFLGGGLGVPIALRSKPYCEPCSTYMRTRTLGSIPASVIARKVRKNDTEAQAKLADDMQAAHDGGIAAAQDVLQAAAREDSGRIREILDRHASEQKAIGKLPVRLRMQLSACPRCFDGLLACDLLTGQGSEQKVERVAAVPSGPNLSRML